MFRRVRSSLPRDPIFPTNFKELGFFIDDDDQIKDIKYPSQGYRYRITNNNRYNDVFREALHTCIRNEVTKRMVALNIPPLYLPSLTLAPPPAPTPHMAIYCTPPHLLRTKRHIIVHINGTREDHGIHTYRLLSPSQDGNTLTGRGITEASVVSIANEVSRRMEDEEDFPGVIVLNPGQLLFSHDLNKAVSLTSWDAMARPSAVHPAPRIDDQWNKIQGNHTAEEHVRFVFQRIICNSDLVSADAELYVMAVGDGGDLFIDFLDKHWLDGPAASVSPSPSLKGKEKDTTKLRPRIAAVAMTAPTPVLPPSKSCNVLPNDRVLEFLAAKARIWAMSHHSLDTPLANADPLEHVRFWRATDDDNHHSSEETREEAAAVAAARAAVKSALDNLNISNNNTAATGATSTKSQNVKAISIPIPRPTEATLATTVSSGVDDFAECVMPASYGAILDWFEEVAREGEGYEHPQMYISEEVQRERIERATETGQGWRDTPWGSEEGVTGRGEGGGGVDGNAESGEVLLGIDPDELEGGNDSDQERFADAVEDMD